MSSHPQGILNDFPYQIPVGHKARRRFYDFLIPPLDTAFTFPEMGCIALSITDNLDFDMSESVHGGFLCENLLRGALLNGSFDCRCEGCFISDETYATSSTAIYSFDHDGISDFGSELLYRFGTVGRCL
jgi:hypothetical protein